MSIFDKDVFDKNENYVFPKFFPLFKCPGRAHTGPYGPTFGPIPHVSGSKLRF